MTQQEEARPLDEIPLGELEYKRFPGDYFAEALKENGLEIMFGVAGGDDWLLTDPCSRLGIKVITVHHEQTAAYAADAYGRIKHEPAVCFLDTGPGTSNAACGIAQMFYALSPALVISGCTIGTHEGLYTWQPSSLEKSYGHVLKWSRRCAYPHMIKRVIAQGFRDSQAYPSGPVGIEWPLWTLNTDIERSWPPTPALPLPHVAYVDQWRGEDTGKRFPPPMGDAATVEKIVKRIFAGKKPLILAGDGVNYAEASPELIEFMELAQVPGCGRRSGRGCLPENHPLNCRYEAYVFEADPLITIGCKLGVFEGTFSMGWPSAIQINEAADHIATHLKTEIALVANPKQALRQMIDYIKAHDLKPTPEMREWGRNIETRELKARDRLMAKAEKYKNHKPVHHGWLSRVMHEVVEDLYGGMNRVYLDGFTISSFAAPFFQARYSSQILDAGEQAGVGHSIGQSIGAYFADPERAKAPALCLLGDAGMGVAGFDIETAARYDIPAVYVVCNNNGWMSSIEYLNYGKGWAAMGPQDRPYGMAFLPGIRYDKMAEVFPWAHGEYVEEPEQIRPALERAFRAAEKGGVHGKGGPAIVNVQMDPTLLAIMTYSAGVSVLYAHIPYKEISKRSKQIRHYYLGQESPTSLPWFDFAKWGFPPVEAPDPWEPVSDEEAVP